MKKKWLCILLAVLMLIAAAPAAMADPEITEDSIVTIVNVRHSANVREQATSESNKLGEAKKGKTFKLLAVEGEGKWYKIQYKSDKVGYVFHLYVKVGKKGEQPVTGKGTVVKDSGRVNIRSKPTTKGDNIVGTAVNGDTFDVTGKSGNWYRINYNKDSAYIHKKYFKVTSTPATPEVNPGEKGYIKCKNYVTVRAEASSSSKSKGTLKRGAEVTVQSISGNWSEVTYSGGSGYVYTKYISATNPDDVSGKTATVVNCKKFVNVRAAASSKSDLLGTADKGSTWTAKALSGNWVKIEYGSKVGFIHKKYISIG